ncbi:hypothetical protein ACFWU3_33310 [Streptomyces sp. NPDC058685]|uniref:hypothetical protein n=1 Tax=Streptomyces sp. NPDC058685 TaxID=3346598 RepID=UPI0036642A11
MHVPASGVVCAGDVLFVDDVPVHWAGPLAGVIDACQTILDLHPRVVVPGHGPLIGPHGVRDYIAYLSDVRDRIHALHQKGLPFEDASRELMRTNDHDLGLPERLAVLTATEYRHLDADDSPLDLVEVLTAAVCLAPEVVPVSVPSRQSMIAALNRLL